MINRKCLLPVVLLGGLFVLVEHTLFLAADQKAEEPLVLTGVLAAPRQVEIKARATGFLQKLTFQDGDVVKEGDLLFEIDPRPYRAQVDKAQAALVQAQARHKLTATDAKRLEQLVTKGAASREEHDKALAEAIIAEAAVVAARAELETARLNLDFTQVRSPINGRIGRALLTVGSLVRGDEGVLAIVRSVDPIHVYFEADEPAMARLKSILDKAKAADVRDAKITVHVALAGDKGYPHAGLIDFVDKQVEPKTGTLQVRGVLANPKELLVPGMRVRVRLP